MRFNLKIARLRFTIIQYTYKGKQVHRLTHPDFRLRCSPCSSDRTHLQVLKRKLSRRRWAKAAVVQAEVDAKLLATRILAVNERSMNGCKCTPF